MSEDFVHEVIRHIPYLSHIYDFRRRNFLFLAIIGGSALMLLTLLGKEMRTALADLRKRRKSGSHDGKALDGGIAGKACGDWPRIQPSRQDIRDSMIV